MTLRLLFWRPGKGNGKIFIQKYVYIILWAFQVFYFSHVSAQDSWITSIRNAHPRLFFNQDTWPEVKARALNQEKEWYFELREKVDGYPDNPTIEYARTALPYDRRENGSYITLGYDRVEEVGVQAAHTAFVYRMTEDPRYCAKAKRMLAVAADLYRECYEKRMTVNWYSTSRVHWLTAYDWIYNDLTPSERRELMGPFLDTLQKLLLNPERPAIYRLNDTDHTQGFYGDRNIAWFAGLAAYDNGIQDELALKFLRMGYQYNRDLFAYRARCAGDDGGLASATCGYSMGAYPWSQFNFMYTWKSATGEDISRDWPHLAYFPVWILWNWLPGPFPREFGTGDTFHYDNALYIDELYTHLANLRNFYGKLIPDCASLAAYLSKGIPEKERKYTWTWAFYPFLMTALDNAPLPANPPDSEIYARHFEALGQIFMRSGTGKDDTYSLFTIGAQIQAHKQYDENNFIIYKKGYLALDSGTRGEESGYQLNHYYVQTVAHNSMLIHMPDEPLPGYWGQTYEGKEGKVCYGGEYRALGGKCLAFETNDHYTYIAGDATPSYRPEKCALALRQYVFVMPDHFIICDRVVSTNPDYKKSWLLHTQNEPMIEGNTFRADQEEGRLFCRVLYPPDAIMTKIGGPGMEFYAAGKNWELEPEVAEKWQNEGLMGKWRIETSPNSPRREDVFLHVIQACDQSVQTMDDAEFIEGNGTVGVKISSKEKSILVTFGTKDDPSGHIGITSGNVSIIDKALATHVQPQSGLTGR